MYSSSGLSTDVFFLIKMNINTHIKYPITKQFILLVSCLRCHHHLQIFHHFFQTNARSQEI